MKLDLHVHIKRNSSCAKQQPADAVLEAIANDIDGLVLLDHKYHATEADLPNSSIQLFRGAEVHIKNEKTRVEDHIVIVTDQKIPFPLQLDSKDAHVLEAFKGPDKLLIWAHPFRKSRRKAFKIHDFIPDAMEILSPNTPHEHMQTIESIAYTLNISLLACSDSHKPGRIGKWYIETDVFVDSYFKLSEVVRSQQYEIFGLHQFKRS